MNETLKISKIITEVSSLLKPRMKFPKKQYACIHLRMLLSTTRKRALFRLMTFMKLILANCSNYLTCS